ncbi:Xaa-Pro peptidase family protein [Wukongibacter baidiensis]|uniref:M24 family metallopeptidase n=1 Tax=Wukongibacter baidiensis TaxID=1723361 RepID=UPI003D7FA5FB
MIPRYPDFSKEEFQGRWSRAQELMKREGIDGLLVTERLNYMYFTGHNSVQNRIDKIRPYVFILPQEGEGVLITMPFEVEQVYDTSWVQEIKEAGLINHADLIAETLREKGLDGKVIGCELGREQYLGLNYLTFNEIMDQMSDSKFVDASKVFLELRSIKSPKEIEYIKTAASIAAQAEMETFAEVKLGMSEIEISNILRRKIAEKGGENVTFLLVAIGEGPTGGSVLVPTPQVVKEGVTLCLDVGVEYRGLSCDICRTAFVGAPPEEAADFYRWMMKLRYECDDMLVAGNTPAMIIDHVNAEVKARGLKLLGVGRVGHGVGYETTEYPSLAAVEDIVFKPGMTFACNPNFVEKPYGMFNCEDNWAISESGKPELLSVPRAPKEITVINV